MSLYTENYWGKRFVVEGDIYERQHGREASISITEENGPGHLSFDDMTVHELLGIASVAMALAMHKLEEA